MKCIICNRDLHQFPTLDCLPPIYSSGCPFCQYAISTQEGEEPELKVWKDSALTEEQIAILMPVKRGKK